MIGEVLWERQIDVIWFLASDKGHIVPFGKFHRIGGAPLETFHNVKYDAPEEVGGNRKYFDSSIRK